MKLIFWTVLLAGICTSANIYAASMVCTTEVRHFCNELDDCVSNKDKKKSTYNLVFSTDNSQITITKSIGKKVTSNWTAKLNPTPFTDDLLMYVESKLAQTTFSVNPKNKRFVLVSPNSSDESIWAQVEIGFCH